MTGATVMVDGGQGMQAQLNVGSSPGWNTHAVLAVEWPLE